LTAAAAETPTLSTFLRSKSAELRARSVGLHAHASDDSDLPRAIATLNEAMERLDDPTGTVVRTVGSARDVLDHAARALQVAVTALESLALSFELTARAAEELDRGGNEGDTSASSASAGGAS
jgi:hypothetical protein